MPEILIVGDSLAGGMPAANFALALEIMLEDATLVARPLGGDTLAGIARRSLRLLAEHRPETMILVAGANDILLPYLDARGGIWSMLAKRLKGRGVPTAGDIDRFLRDYAELLKRAAGVGVATLLTTVTCLGEDNGSDLNARRRDYNRAIRLLARERGVPLADTGKAFDEVLDKLDAPSGYLMDELSGMVLDPIRCITARGIDKLSGRRGLALTIDGVHLNRLGARLFAQTVYRSLCP